MAAIQNEGYSATVAIRLEVAGKCLDVAQAGEQMLVLREPCDCPEGEAKLVVTVDGEEFGYDIVLFEGISRDSEIVHFF